MEPSKAFLYHSFPRRREGDVDHTKGLKILESIFKSGLLITPEVYKLQESLTDDSNGQEIIVVQKRVCFTEISESELADHASHFGDITLQFELDSLLQSGLSPVFYLPQNSQEKIWGPYGTLLTRISEVQVVLKRLEILDNMAKDPTLQEEELILKGDSIDEIHTGLRIKDMSPILSALECGVRPFKELHGAIRSLSSLFYPMENTRYSGKLGYYRQREWRIGSDLMSNGVPLAKDLTLEEKDVLVGLDKVFYEKELRTGNGLKKIVDLSKYLRKIGDKKTSELITKIVIPETIIPPVKELLKKYNLDIELAVYS
ncbi:abortive infection system antitoxin AbiGi family protein [Pedobacter psychroterrae]|uniref:Uncharacterized protein n=1 Tax=Pedobacter psychroterrae TaxID=2530453 RepID=A0A4V2ML93_9SPHI|nr:abortive infection system antitoxin AbiGi family protein [Pedobacter psychroterrae]TCD01217.1 hypothetical protein EZ437_10695 [Pedobacter psychroterrae]